MVMKAIDQIPGEFGLDGGTGGGGGAGTGRVGPATNALRVYDPDTLERSRSLDYEIKWTYIEKTIKPGAMRPGAKLGEVDVQMGTSLRAFDLGQDSVFASSPLVLRKQLQASYEEIEVFGLQFTNWVYDGKSVVINAHDAFYKKDEEGFIIPLNAMYLRALSLRDSTQLSYDCCHLVLNSYQIVKKKWYQKGIFKVLLVIVSIVLVVLFPPAGMASLQVSVGAAIGIAATSLLVKIIAATLVVLAGMVLSKLLTPVLVEVFGEKWGRVIALVASMVIMSPGSLGQMVNAPMTATTLINHTSAVLQMYTAYNQGAMIELDVPGQMEKLKTDYESKMDEIDKLTKEFLSPGSNLIDIEGFIEATTLLMEDPRDFFSRTLMTGSDIASVTAGQIENFADVGLQLPNTG